MGDNIFDLSYFNVIQDDEYYYFFRALSDDDYNDVVNSITTENGELRRIRTDLERCQDNSIYNQDDNISLEEVHDHIKWLHRKDTKCISLTTNANIASIYGYSNHHNQYAMVKVPKSQVRNGDFYLAGEFIIQEIQKRIDDIIRKYAIDDERIALLDAIRKARTNEELFELLNDFYQKNGKDFNTSKYYDYFVLNDEQNLEKNKSIAQIDIINRRLLTRCSNKMLLETLKFSFTSSEIIHYGEIGKDITLVPQTTIDLFSLLQQAKSMGFDSKKIEELELKIIECSERKYRTVEGKYGPFSTQISDYNTKTDGIKISDIYRLTEAKISFSKAHRALLFSYEITKSRLRVHTLCSLLREMVKDSSFDDLINSIEANSYLVKPSIVARNSQEGLRLTDSLCLNMNAYRKNTFSLNEQNAILQLINSLSDENKVRFISEDLVKSEGILCSLLTTNSSEDISMNRYYAETILDYLKLDEIYSNSYVEREYTNDEKERILSYLDKANCVNMFDSLLELGLSYNDISVVIFNLLLNNGYNGINFIDLSNRSDFKEIISSNLDKINTKISALRMDYLLGIRDNDNNVLSTNITLRDYQQLAVDRLNEIFETKNFAGVVLPTGAGKSFVAIAEMLKYKDKNILYYAPNREILRQLQKHIVKHVLNMNVIPESKELYYMQNKDKIPSGYIFQSDMEEMITAAFPQLKMFCYQGLTTADDESFKMRDAGLIVLDEVHRTGAREWNEKIKLLIRNNPDAKILGITATPVRDVDNQNMVDKLAEFSGSFTTEEIKKKKHMAAEMYLVDAMQEGIVVTPNIVTFDYSLENSDYYKEVKSMYESEENPLKKDELKKIYDEMRRIVEVSKSKGMAQIIKEGFENNNKPSNGRYIVFLPTNSNSDLTTEEYVLREIEKVKEYFKEIDPNPEVEYLLSDRKSKSENASAISRFENDSDHLKLIFAINMLNEGVHVNGIDGVIMLRPLQAGTKILYYQQIGRCIYSLDPNHELEPHEFPVIFDVYNNYLEQNMDRQVNRHTITSDLQKLYIIKEWISKHFRYPDINSTSIDEARKAITLKRIQKKYFIYLENPTYSSNLSDSEIYEIEEIIRIGKSIDLWDIELGERVIDPKAKEIEQFKAFKLKGEQRKFVELFKEASSLTSKKTRKDNNLRLIEILNVLDVLSENNVDINNSTIPLDSLMQNIYSKLPPDVLDLIKQDLNVSPGYEIGIEYSEARKQFYKKNPIFLDYSISTLRKMGIFEPGFMYNGFLNTQITDSKGFIIYGPSKFVGLNIYTGTYYDPNGLDISGLDEMRFSLEDELFNKYGFGRDGYYYELTSDGEHVKTDSIYNPYGFDIKGDYYERQADGTYKNLGKIDRHGFDIDGFYYKYNSITKEYVKTKSIFNENSFDRDGIFYTLGNSTGHRKRSIVYCDGTVKSYKNVEYVNDSGVHVKTGTSVKFPTNLPYDLNYFDIDGIYYEPDEYGNRVKSDRPYNERFFDGNGYYYEKREDGTVVKTDRLYNDDYFDMNGYYYELDEYGNRKKTFSLTDELGFNCDGLKVIYTLNPTGINPAGNKIPYHAFDKDGFCYEYSDLTFKKIVPETKISRFGFDIDGYYHELLEDGTRSKERSDKRVDKYGFNENGICLIKGDSESEEKKESIINERGFRQDGYYCKKPWDMPISKVDNFGFDMDGLFEHKLSNGTTKKLPFNNRFLSRDGYYYKKVRKEDGTVTVKKTNRKVDARGFALNGLHYDVEIDSDNNYVYKNPKKYDKHGFDVDGYYWPYQTIEFVHGGKRIVQKERVKSKPPRIYDEYGFNCRGYYCIIHLNEIEVTDSKYNPVGFDIDHYYKDLDENGQKTKYNPDGVDIDGNLPKERTEKKLDTVFKGKYYPSADGHLQSGIYVAENHFGIIETNKYGFDKMNCYRDYTGEAISVYNPRGFDAFGYYHKLMPDNTRVNTGNAYDDNFFDIDGYYYKLSEDGTRVKTDNKYNPEGIDCRGFRVDKIHSITGTEYDLEGLDVYGFNEEGIHYRTNTIYDENYFLKDGTNIMTDEKYSITGHTITGEFNKNMVHQIMLPVTMSDFNGVKRAKEYLLKKYNENKNKRTIRYDSISLRIVAVSFVLDADVQKLFYYYITQLSIEELNQFCADLNATGVIPLGNVLIKIVKETIAEKEKSFK